VGESFFDPALTDKAKWTIHDELVKRRRGERMKKVSTSIDEQILRASKEIIVKFIEVGRVSPTSFGESFKDVYTAIDDTVKAAVNAVKDEAIPEKTAKKNK